MPAVPARLDHALRSASAATGTPFAYLLDTAMRESALDPTARASTSSAAGLFQFIESTWLEMIKEEGAKYGLAAEAAAIEPRRGGGYRVADPETRRAILALRDDPAVSAVMAGEYARRNGEALKRVLGRQPTGGELYIAHFLGPDGAARFLRAAAADPAGSAAAAFPAQAAANRAIFYDRAGVPRSFAEVHAVLVRDHGGEPAMPAAAPAAALAFVGEPAAPPSAPFALALADGAAPPAAADAIALPGRFAPPEGAATPGVSRFAPLSAAEVAPPSRFALLALQQLPAGAGGSVPR